MPKDTLIIFATLILLFDPACQLDTETVEVRNEYGQLERYTRRKKDFAKEGLYQRFHEKGYLLEEAHFVSDTLDGERRFFYPGGHVERISHYRRGLTNGVFQQFYENGRLQLEQTFVNGVLEGQSKAWYPNGVLKEMVTLRDNEENGPFTEWYPNGNIKTEGQYLDGDNPDGPMKLYDTLGQLERILQCQRGICRSSWVKPGLE